MTHRPETQKYRTIYMSTGICCGVFCGILLEMLQNPDHPAAGICLGILAGMCLGLTVGYFKDRKLSGQMMKVSRIEYQSAASEALVYAVDREGTEREYRISGRIMKREKFSVGDRAAEETDGSLVSLESI